MKTSALALTCLFGYASAEIRAYYSWNWGAGSTGSSGSNQGVAFTGLVDVDQAIAQYTPGAAWCCPELKGSKPWISIGGGNSAGLFTASTLSAVTQNMAKIPAANYGGIVYDVEEVQGSSATMIPLFRASFAAAKAQGLEVIVTTSHSAPYACDTPQDAVDFVKAWVADSNIDVLSPQLYSSGYEGSPELAETNSCKDAGCTWDLYKGYGGVIAPSIVRSSQYAASQSFFQGKGINLGGYIEWAQIKSAVVKDTELLI